MTMDYDDIRGDERESEDDALEDSRYGNTFHPEEDEDKLPEDNATPAAPADDVRSSAPLDDPSSDDGEDRDERYQYGDKVASDESDLIIGPENEPQPVELEHEDDEE
jgi:hypothetical protein